ncbi:MAG: carbohydrate ABC transporter permease, partial [Candidatus Ornithospirochaeta sp.]
MKNQYVGKVGVGEILSYIFLTLVLIFAVLPLLFMATAAFMDAKQIMSMPYTWIPSSKYFTTSSRTFFTNFQKAIVGNHGDNIFFRNLLNSLVVAATCAFTTVILASLCGYGLAKFRFKG